MKKDNIKQNFRKPVGRVLEIVSEDMLKEKDVTGNIIGYDKLYNLIILQRKNGNLYVESGAGRNPIYDFEKNLIYQSVRREDSIVIKRLRYADSTAVILETDFFPPSFDFLASEPLSTSTNEILNRHNIFPLHGVNTISICYATEEEAQLFGIEVDSPLLYVYSEIKDQNMRPVQVSKQIIRSELYKLVLTS